MSMVCPLGAVPKFNNFVVIRSNDHFPPHVHVLDSGNELLYRLAIPGYDITMDGKFISRKIASGNKVEINDIVSLDRELTIKEKKIIISMWNSKVKGKNKKRWESARDLWNSIHKDETY